MTVNADFPCQARESVRGVSAGPDPDEVRPPTPPPILMSVVKLPGASLQSVVVLGERRALTKRDDTPPVTEISHLEKALDLLV